MGVVAQCGQCGLKSGRGGLITLSDGMGMFYRAGRGDRGFGRCLSYLHYVPILLSLSFYSRYQMCPTRPSPSPHPPSTQINYNTLPQPQLWYIVPDSLSYSLFFKSDVLQSALSTHPSGPCRKERGGGGRVQAISPCWVLSLKYIVEAIILVA